jgi:hypothetical protein
MKILSHRHTGIIINDFDGMLKFYVGMGLVLRRRDLEQGQLQVLYLAGSMLAIDGGSIAVLLINFLITPRLGV